MTAGTPPRSALQQRWERIGLGVRCAYNPQRTEVIHCYVQAGRHLARAQPRHEPRIQQRMLALLLQTAADPALPWHWRASCLEHTTWPLARLTSLLPRAAGGLAAANEAAVQHAHEALGLPHMGATEAAASGSEARMHPPICE